MKNSYHLLLFSFQVFKTMCINVNWHNYSLQNQYITQYIQTIREFTIWKFLFESYCTFFINKIILKNILYTPKLGLIRTLKTIKRYILPSLKLVYSILIYLHPTLILGGDESCLEPNWINKCVVPRNSYNIRLRCSLN